MTPHPKPKVYHDLKYLAYVRKHPCSHCAGPAEAHHLAGKENDYATVPLCRTAHRYYHDHGLNGFESRFSTNANPINLWREAHALYLNYVTRASQSSEPELE